MVSGNERVSTRSIENTAGFGYRHDGAEKAVRLKPADMFIAEAGDAHVAHPIGPARVLVIEKEGTV